MTQIIKTIKCGCGETDCTDSIELWESGAVQINGKILFCMSESNAKTIAGAFKFKKEKAGLLEVLEEAKETLYEAINKRASREMLSNIWHKCETAIAEARKGV